MSYNDLEVVSPMILDKWLLNERWTKSDWSELVDWELLFVGKKLNDWPVEPD